MRAWLRILAAIAFLAGVAAHAQPFNPGGGGGSGGGCASSAFGVAFPNTGCAMGGEYLSSQPTLTNGFMYGLRLTAVGGLIIDDEATNNQLHTDLTSATPAGTNVIGYVSNDPCAQSAKTNVPISTASGTTALVTGVSAKKIYVCSLLLVVPSAVSVSLAEGSSATCGTSNQAAVIGVATNGTAANGMPFAANGGTGYGNGSGTIASTATAADYLCLFQSGTAQIAGNLTYVQQ